MAFKQQLSVEQQTFSNAHFSILNCRIGTKFRMEMDGFEPTASAVQVRRSSN